MIGKKTVTAIILAAGNSTRFGKKKNKNLEMINRKFVLTYSLEAFDKNVYIDNIIIATKDSEIAHVCSVINSKTFTKDIKIVVGGSSRRESVCNCIKNTSADIVIIHDAARPLIKQEYISSCIENMNDFKGVTIAVKSKDTIKVTDDNNIVLNTTNRANTWIIQTPQCFDRATLLKAHQKNKIEEVTDDCSLLEKEGHKIKVIPGDYSNIKITTIEDLNIIREIYSKLEK